jgi:D-alanyl-D-alanine carboxypeptidase
MTSNIANILRSASAIGTGALLSPASHALQVAPLTAKFKPWSADPYYGLGVFVINGWIVQNPSFAGYAATMAHLPSQKLAIAVSVTLGREGVIGRQSLDRRSEEIAAYLAPGAPL